MRAPVAEPQEVSARELLEMIGGSRCPCGHTAEQHDTRPHGDFGPCNVCQCQGMIDVAGCWDEDDDEPVFDDSELSPLD